METIYHARQPPPHTTNSYANLMKATIPNASTNKGPVTHIPDTLPTLDATNPAPLHIMEINDHKTLLHKKYVPR